MQENHWGQSVNPWAFNHVRLADGGNRGTNWKTLLVVIAEQWVLDGNQSSRRFQDELLQWFFGLRAQGIMLSTRLVVVKASTLSAEFRRKTTRAKELAVRRLLASNRIVTRAVDTHMPAPSRRSSTRGAGFHPLPAWEGCRRKQIHWIHHQHGPDANFLWHAQW